MPKPVTDPIPQNPSLPPVFGGGAPKAGSARVGAEGRPRDGRAGLSATVAAAADLLEEGDRAHAGIPTDARDLLVAEIAPDPLQPRRHFDEAELKALADDIARRGVLQPVLVRPPAAPGGPYRLVAGERRWRAAQMAGKARLPARVRDLSDDDVRAAQLAENVLRAGLTDIEKGRALRRLYELRKNQDHRATWEDVAAEVGLGRARIHDLYQLATLPEPVAALIESGRLSGSHGIALQRAQALLGEERLVELAREASRSANRRAGGFGMSVARLRERIQAETGRAESTEAAGRANVSPAVGTPAAPISAAAAATGNGPAPGHGEPLRPFLRRTLEALQAGVLSPQERQLLRQALEGEASTVQPSAEYDTRPSGDAAGADG